MGALKPATAMADAEHARGYSEGLEEGRAESTDRFKTILLRLYESRYGEADDQVLEVIEFASALQCEKWILAGIDGEALDVMLRGVPIST